MATAKSIARRVGSTPQARIQWLLDFLRCDPAQLSPARKAVAVDSLFAIQGRRTALPRRADIRWAPQRYHDQRWLVGDVHELLRGVVETLANGRPYYLAVPELIWKLEPPAPRPPSARYSAPVTRESAQAEIDWRVMPAMVALAFVDDLNALGADRLRACPLVERSGKRCGVVFLGRRRKRYCTPRHAQAAAWDAYLARGGDVTRKRTRA
jgi:hypothetical protein